MIERIHGTKELSIESLTCFDKVHGGNRSNTFSLRHILPIYGSQGNYKFQQMKLYIAAKGVTYISDIQRNYIWQPNELFTYMTATGTIYGSQRQFSCICLFILHALILASFVVLLVSEVGCSL